MYMWLCTHCLLPFWSYFILEITLINLDKNVLNQFSCSFPKTEFSNWFQWNAWPLTAILIIFPFWRGGSNDPLAIFLQISLHAKIQSQQASNKVTTILNTIILFLNCPILKSKNQVLTLLLRVLTLLSNSNFHIFAEKECEWIDSNNDSTQKI